MRIYHPIRLLKVPRCLETILQSMVFVLCVVIYEFLGLSKIKINDIPISSKQEFYILSIICLFVYIIYRNLSTFTPVNLLQIDEDKKEIIISYDLFYLMQRKCVIKFNEFSFYTKNDVFIFGSSNSIRMYQHGEFKIKLNARCGWKEGQIKELTDIFLQITDGKVIEKKWVPW